MKDRLIHYAEFFGFLLAAVALWFTLKPHPAPIGTTILAKPAQELQNKPKVELHPEKVQAYTAPVKKNLGLPADVQDDPNKYVLGSARLPADTHPHTITTVIDSKNGSVQTFDRRDPLPWLSAEQTGEIRIDYGFKNNLAKVARLTLREDLFQVKAFHLSFNASIDGDRAWFAGVGIGYRW